MTPHRPEELFSVNGMALQPSAIEAIHKLLEQPGMRSLAGAWPDPSVFPAADIGEIISELLNADAGLALQYGSTRGYPALRQALAELSRGQNGAKVSADQILVTSGSSQGLDLACRLFLDPGDVVLVGLPSYFGATATITSQGGINFGVLVDGDGLRTDLIKDAIEGLRNDGRRVKAVYVIPNFQNPSGVTLSLDRRKQLIDLAERFQFMIFEDDPYGELRFEGEQLPSLAALDESGWVVHFHSTSKTFAPGMRVAWATARADVIDKMEGFKQATDISSNSLAQLVLLQLIRSGRWQSGIERIRFHYRKKRDLMLGLMTAHFPKEVRWTRPQGGFFTFVTLPAELNGDELLLEALEEKIAYVSGSAFFVDGSGRNTFRLSFSQASTGDIESAIPRLGELISKRLQGSSSTHA
jgi:2-aminoadipate transaminase